MSAAVGVILYAIKSGAFRLKEKPYGHGSIHRYAFEGSEVLKSNYTIQKLDSVKGFKIRLPSSLETIAGEEAY